jgi:hypothetical protein
MMEDPGCSAGRLISAKPVFGPEESRRRSFEMRITSKARFLNADETAAMARFDSMA